MTGMSIDSTLGWIILDYRQTHLSGVLLKCLLIVGIHVCI